MWNKEFALSPFTKILKVYLQKLLLWTYEIFIILEWKIPESKTAGEGSCRFSINCADSGICKLLFIYYGIPDVK